MHMLLPLPFLIISSFTDIKTRKIKNHTTLPMMVSGLIYWSITAGYKGLLYSMLGLLFAGFIIAIMPGFSCGGGDIKLLAGCGAWAGSIYSSLQLFTIVIGLTALTALTTLVIKEGIINTIKQIKLEILSCLEIKNENISITMAPVIMVSFLIWIMFF